jgi:hypothetical protein
MTGDPSTDVYAWDKLAEEKGFDLKQPGQEYAASKVIGDRPFGPHKHAMPSCKSGGYEYCTCDTCF